MSAAAITPSRITPETAAFTKIDWSFSSRMRNEGGRVCFRRGSTSLTPCTIDRVEAEPALRMVASTERRPSTRTTFCCGGAPSRTWATSRT